MATISFEIENDEVSLFRQILDKFGAKKIKIKDDKINLDKIIQESREEKKRGELTTIDVKNIWESI
ncbi:MAG: hypothetical protein H6604_03830 [Flavobacteriales bacterium]|nr:hypothetical protein [Flavobacteriales bacterium]